MHSQIGYALASDIPVFGKHCAVKILFPASTDLLLKQQRSFIYKAKQDTNLFNPAFRHDAGEVHKAALFLETVFHESTGKWSPDVWKYCIAHAINAE